MSKKFAKFFGVGLALVLALSLSLVTAVPAAAQGAPIGDPFFTTGGEGKAGWSTEHPKFGDYSAKLWIPADDGELPYDEARLVFNYDGDLNSITGVSYPSYVIGGNDGTLYPSVVLAVDITGDLVVDSWVVQFTPYDHEPSENAWETISFDGSSPVHVAGNRAELGALMSQTTDRYAPYTTETTATDTLASLTAETLDGELTWGDVAVLEVKAYIGEFTNLTEPMTAYVDDITINDDLYELEPSSTVGLVAELEEITAISVTPTSIDFGTLSAGKTSSAEAITVENIGTVMADVETNVALTGTVFDHLTVNGLALPTIGLIDKLPFGEAIDVEAQLVIPDWYSAKGIETNQLIFVASSP